MLQGKKDDAQLLSNAVFNTLMKSQELSCSSVSIPAISSGIYGFPKPLCAQVLFATVENFVELNKTCLDKLSLNSIRFTNFDDETVNIFKDEFIKRYQRKVQAPLQSQPKVEINKIE